MSRWRLALLKAQADNHEDARGPNPDRKDLLSGRSRGNPAIFRCAPNANNVKTGGFASPPFDGFANLCAAIVFVAPLMCCRMHHERMSAECRRAE
jgi:hypothetical protein